MELSYESYRGVHLVSPSSIVPTEIAHSIQGHRDMAVT